MACICGAFGRRASAPRRGGVTRMALFGPRALLAPQRGERRQFALFLVMLGVLAYLPVSVAVQDSPFGIGSFGVAVDAVKVTMCAVMTPLIVRQYMHGNGLKRITATIEHVGRLRRSMRDRTAVERLAILQEMRNCYAEADKYVAGVGDKEIVQGIAVIRMHIESMYGQWADEVGHSKADAAEFARTMELLGRGRDGGKTQLGR